MNLILFEPAELSVPLSRTDPRAIHLLDILRRNVGDIFDAGLINGHRGKGTLRAITPDALTFTFDWGPAPPPLDPITLIIGLPRPQTARKILQEATALGVASMHFVRTERGDPNYATSSLWSSGEWRRHLIVGAEQAFCTRLPEITHGRTLPEIVAVLPVHDARLALDNYEAPSALSTCHLSGDIPVVLALGAERGWSPAERDFLRANQFTFAHLGSRVLRTETAVIAALAVIKAKRGSM